MAWAGIWTAPSGCMTDFPKINLPPLFICGISITSLFSIFQIGGGVLQAEGGQQRVMVGRIQPVDRIGYNLGINNLEFIGNKDIIPERTVGAVQARPHFDREPGSAALYCGTRRILEIQRAFLLLDHHYKRWKNRPVQKHDGIHRRLELRTP